MALSICCPPFQHIFKPPTCFKSLTRGHFITIHQEYAHFLNSAQSLLTTVLLFLEHRHWQEFHCQKTVQGQPLLEWCCGHLLSKLKMLQFLGYCSLNSASMNCWAKSRLSDQCFLEWLQQADHKRSFHWQAIQWKSLEVQARLLFRMFYCPTAHRSLGSCGNFLW